MAHNLRPMSLNTSFDQNGQTPARGTASAKSRSPTGTTSSAGSKRKRGTDEKFYAVRIGHNPGVYYTWADCLAQVTGFKKATCKSFAESLTTQVDQRSGA